MNLQDPVELAILGPILRADDGFEAKLQELVDLGFTYENLPTTAGRTLWLKATEWINEGKFTPEKLLSFCLGCIVFGMEPCERSVWLSTVGGAGSVLNIVENGLELIERSIKADVQEATALKPGATSGEVLDEIETKIALIRQKASKRVEDEKAGAIVELLEELGAMERGERVMRQSHVPTWDQALGGLPNAQLIVLAGRPGGGKTSLAEQIIDEAVRRNTPVLYIQRELSRSRAVGRLAARKAGVDWCKMEAKKLNKFEISNLRDEVKKYEELPLYLAPVTNCNSATLTPIVRNHCKNFGVKLVVMDYLQLINVPRGMEMRTAIGEVTRCLKLSANATGATIIGIAQLSRESEKSGNKPSLSDLKESGNIEQDADVVLSLWCSKDREDNSRWPVNWTLAKNRNGPLGTIEVMFDGPSMSFLGRTFERKN